MAEEHNLESVPDSSMLALFKSLVNFLTSEAEGRGWADITDRLRAVEKAMTAAEAPAGDKR